MFKTVVQKFQIPNALLSGLVLALVGSSGGINSALAQQQDLPVCQPPNTGEYLLLVISPTADNQKQLRHALPSNIKTTTCRYLKDTVTRIGGFTKIDEANSWAKYINNVAGLSGIITTRPSETARSTEVVQTQPQQVTYKPERLGGGFAVLVDYYNRPEVANQVRQVVGGDVGFVSYGQRPYLLAIYTPNQKEAYSTLEKLSEKGFFALLVDSRKVVLLRSTVRLQ
ncbi:hypothetical protein SAMD00079811_14660 [Scytonema sp. HK-05]|uniref:hypothetical protein n=1 Tax=Scytonema sp. HK-05 TaxID=1137095 RepID=UPI0009366C31|nr:hypothetical protein [Scytonema sp. HK-05]OKH55117.1 hypothetical protein NIES2130_27465 [Scytonema sp. HK-05]BAY43879.1 hypothetical protein SAMD00079811_14660 [Scytonema sp. HK-05]